MITAIVIGKCSGATDLVLDVCSWLSIGAVHGFLVTSLRDAKSHLVLKSLWVALGGKCSVLWWNTLLRLLHVLTRSHCERMD